MQYGLGRLGALGCCRRQTVKMGALGAQQVAAYYNRWVSVMPPERLTDNKIRAIQIERIGERSAQAESVD